MNRFYKDWKEQCKKVLKDPSIRYARIAYSGDKGNSEIDWPKIRNPLRMIFTAFIFEILRKTPPCKIKNSIYRLFGVRIGKNVAIAYNVLPDPLFPELITLEDNVMIGSDCELATHEFVRDWFGIGRIVIKKNAMISAYNLIRAGTAVGEGAMTGIFSYVNKDVPSEEIWVGIPAKLLKKIEGSLKPEHDTEISYYDGRKIHSTRQ